MCLIRVGANSAGHWPSRTEVSQTCITVQTYVYILTDTMLRCHGNMPADDNEEITSLPSPSAFQTTTKSSQVKLSFIVIPLHVWIYSGTRCRASQDHGAT